MTSPDILLADEITSQLNAQSFTLPFVAERVYAPDWDIKKELNELQCGVWSESATGEPFEREELLWNFDIGVAFAQNLKDKTRDEIDGLMDFVWEIVQFLELSSIPLGTEEFVSNDAEIPIRFDPTKLKRQKQPDTSIVYTGIFATHLRFPFKRMTP